MASKSELAIRVTASRGASHITATSKGRYISFTTAGLSFDLPKQPIQPTASLKTYWLSVLAIITAEVNALP